MEEEQSVEKVYNFKRTRIIKIPKRKLMISLGTLTLLLFILVFLRLTSKKTVNIYPTQSPTPIAVADQTATAAQREVFSTYLSSNNFKDAEKINNYTIVNGILSGFSSNSFEIQTVKGVITIPVNPNAQFYIQKLVKDPANPQNKIFSKSFGMTFEPFKAQVPIGTVIQPNYQESSGKITLNSVDAYIDQKAQ